MTWKYPRAKGRIFKHAKNCGYLQMEPRRGIMKEMAGQAVGGTAMVKGGGGNGAEPDAGSEDSDIGDIKDAAPPAKRLKALTTDAAASGSKSKGGMEGFVRAGRMALQKKADHALLVFVTCCGIPPKVVDSREFKSFVSTLSTDYAPPSETTLRDTLIPVEAANIHLAVLEYLKGCRDLTIAFDGGKLRCSKGLYSVHVTTAERRTFCLALDDASRLSHTGEYISELLDEVSENTVLEQRIS
jgi:hypothetical protein